MLKFRNLISNIKKYFTLFKSLYKDKRTPLISKVFLWAAIGYTAMPFDIIPDFIPVIGHIDDIIIVPSLLFVSLKFIPKALYEEHYNRIFKKRIKL